MAPGSGASEGNPSRPRTRSQKDPQLVAQPQSSVLLLRQTILTTGVWFVCIGFGAYLNTGFTPPKAQVPLLWFDMLVRRLGPGLPFPILAMRWHATLPAAGSAASRPLRYKPNLQPLAALYLGLTAARLGLYFLHTLLAPLIVALKAGQRHPHLLSDHIFLGASLIAIFNAEAHMLLTDLRCMHRSRRTLDRMIIVAAIVLTTLLFALTCAEMFYTARFFHGGFESFWAAVLGVLLFQLPTAAFMLRAEFL